MITVRALAIPDVLVLESPVFADGRGHLIESWNARDFAQVGLATPFVQDNVVRSRRGILRGMHYQIAQPQGKLIRVVRGAAFDVAVDMRRSSPTFGRWVGELLTESSGAAIWIPTGFAHGYLAMSDEVDMLYKATDFYAPQHERLFRWDDPAVGIQWPLEAIGVPQVVPRDAGAPLLAAAECYP